MSIPDRLTSANCRQKAQVLMSVCSLYQPADICKTKALAGQKQLRSAPVFDLDVKSEWPSEFNVFGYVWPSVSLRSEASRWVRIRRPEDESMP